MAPKKTGTVKTGAGKTDTGKVAELPDGPPDATGLTPRQQRVLPTSRTPSSSAATRRACARSARRSA